MKNDSLHIVWIGFMIQIKYYKSKNLCSATILILWHSILLYLEEKNINCIIDSLQTPYSNHVNLNWLCKGPSLPKKKSITSDGNN